VGVIGRRRAAHQPSRSAMRAETQPEMARPIPRRGGVPATRLRRFEQMCAASLETKER